jgi:hypothetical protein
MIETECPFSHTDSSNSEIAAYLASWDRILWAGIPERTATGKKVKYMEIRQKFAMRDMKGRHYFICHNMANVSGDMTIAIFMQIPGDQFICNMSKTDQNTDSVSNMELTRQKNICHKTNNIFRALYSTNIVIRSR